MSERQSVSRREFLKSAAAAAVTAHLGTSAFAQEAQPEGLRLGIVGAGNQGRTLMFSAQRAGCKFLAVCDIRKDYREDSMRFAEPDARQYEDYREMLDKEAGNLDGVVIATPLWQHAPVTIAALQAGLHVFCEKTMAATIEDCKAMIRAQQAAKKVLQIGHHLRYHVTYHHAKEAYLKLGLLGQVTFVHAHWNRNTDWRRPVPDELKNVDFTKYGYESPEHVCNWRLYKQYSGGLLTELVSHQTDVVNWLLDATPVAVTAVGAIDYWKDGRTVYDNVHLVFEYPKGTKFHCESLTTNAFDAFGEQAEIIKGVKGTMVLSNVPKAYGIFFLERGIDPPVWYALAHEITIGDHAENPAEARVRDKKGIIMDASMGTAPDKIAGIEYFKLAEKGGWPMKSTYELEMLDFVRSVRNNTLPFCDGNVGLRSAAPAIFAQKAIEQGTRVEIPEDTYVV